MHDDCFTMTSSRACHTTHFGTDSLFIQVLSIVMNLKISFINSVKIIVPAR